MPAGARTDRLDALTGLRFVAAAHVTLFHFGQHAFAALPAWLEHIRRAGASAVSLFFCLSGFLLTQRYLQPLSDGTVSKRRFWRARLARIYPLYFVAILVDVAQRLLPPPTATPHFAASLVTQLLTLQAWTPRLVWYGNLPGWSLSVEVFFYLLFPLLVIPLAKLGPRRALPLMAVAWLLSFVAPVVYLALSPDAGANLLHPEELVWLNLVKFCPLFRLPEFVIGMALGLVFLDDRATSRRRDGALLSALAALTIVVVQANEELVPYPIMHNALLAPAYAVLILGLAHGGGLARILAVPEIVILGEASYALYLLQMPLYLVFAKLLGDVFWETRDLFLVEFTVPLVAICLVAYYFIERPAQRWLSRAR